MDCSKCTNLIGAVGEGEVVIYVDEAVQDIFVVSAQIYCEPKTTLKNKI